MTSIGKTKLYIPNLLILIGSLAFFATVAAPAKADYDDRRAHFRIAPIFSKPGGQTYGRWAAEWFQWAFGVPAATNPTEDPTGEFCDQRQVGDTWFLAGTRPFNAPTVVRECTIPAGKALFVPLLNKFFGAEKLDPPEVQTEAFVREAAKCTEPLEGFAEIDGVIIGERRLNRFSTSAEGSQSPIFTVQLPPGNLFGRTPDDTLELVFTPSAEDGFYLYLKPLSPGEHTIRWLVEGCEAGRSQDVTYHLSVLAAEPEPEEEDDDDGDGD